MVWVLIWLALQTAPAARPQLQACSELLQRGAPEALKSCKAAVAADGRSAAAHMLLGQAYLALGNAAFVAEAKAELQQALDIDPSLVWARFYLARVYLDVGRPDKAKAELSDALAARPNTAHFLSLMGEAERKDGHPEAALEWHRKAMSADPKLNTAHYFAGLAYMDLKQHREAVEELEKSIDSPYVSPELYLTLGSLYALDHRYREAEQLCRKAIALDPSRPESYLNLGQLFNAQHQSDKALAALHKAIPEGRSFGSSPYYQKMLADIHFEFGRAYAEKGDRAAAIESFNKCLVIDSGRSEAREKLATLK